jgi:hypothetical protein
MIVIENTIISEEIRDTFFCCNPEVCHGACCVDGDAGAPLEESEISEIEDNLDRIKPFMLPKGIQVVEKSGVFDYDSEGSYVTALIEDKDCVFVYYENGIARCAIEKAWEEGKISFQKPISCHLYPIRTKSHKRSEAVNFHKWHICESACKLGNEKRLPLATFLKQPLIRKYGQDWYDELSNLLELSKND